MSGRARLGAGAWLAASLLGSASLALEPPALDRRVTDRAGVLGSERAAALEQKLAGYEAKTGHQLAVLIVPSLEGDPIEDFSIRTVERWKLGDRRRDDGLLLLVAFRDRQVRIEVGHGLEGAIPDALAGRIIEERIKPHFRAGRYAEGIDAALTALMAAAQGEALGPPPRPVSPRRPSPGGFSGTALMIIFMLAAFFRRLPGSLRYPSLGISGALAGILWGGVLTALLGGALGLGLAFLAGAGGRGPGSHRGSHGGMFPFWVSSGRSGWSGSGWSGGGGFSGGGGSFGGGGASGRW